MEFQNLDIRNDSQELVPKQLKEVKENVQKLMTENVGIVRDNNGLKRGMDKVKGLFKYLNLNCKESREFEVQNLITLAYLVIKAALIREESRGAHYRKDFSESKVKWRRHIVLQKDRNWEALGIEFK